MRRALGAAVVVALASPASALAEPLVASIKSFKATPVIQPVPTCAGCGPAVDLELEYALEGEGYAAYVGNPKGGIPPLSGVNLLLPTGVQVHPAGFAQCTEATLKNTGPSGCPSGSLVSNIGEAQEDVTFGPSRANEEATLQTYASAGGLLVFEHGASPVNVEVIWNGHFASSHAPPYEEELIAALPAVATVPGAPLRSIRSFRLVLGASGAGAPYLSLPATCPVGGLPFKTEVTFGGENGSGREFGFPAQTVAATYPAACPPGLPPPPPPPPPPPTAAQIAAVLGEELVPSGKAARIGALLKHRGYARTVRALEAGKLAIGWYELPRGARLARRRPKPLLVASGTATFTAAGSERITIRLTARGRRLLRHVHRLSLVAKGDFTPAGTPKVTVLKRFTVRR